MGENLFWVWRRVFFLEDSICFLLSLLSSVVSSLENLPRSKKTLGKKERGGREGQVGIPAIIPLHGLGLLLLLFCAPVPPSPSPPPISLCLLLLTLRQFPQEKKARLYHAKEKEKSLQQIATSFSFKRKYCFINVFPFCIERTLSFPFLNSMSSHIHYSPPHSFIAYSSLLFAYVYVR